MNSLTPLPCLTRDHPLTLIDEIILQKLGIRGKQEQLTLQWFGNHTSSEQSQIVDIDISGIEDATKYKLKEVRSVKQIDLPLQTLNIADLHMNDRCIKRLPINSYRDAKPMLLIGLNHSYLGAPLQTSVRSSNNGPIAIKTKLGWIVYGPYQNLARGTRGYQFHTSKVTDENMEQAMADYFTSENFGVKINNLESNSDKLANHLLKSTTVRLNNKYQTGLLWRDATAVLPIGATRWQ